MTFEKEWGTYKQACYPEGCNKLQESECRQAFFSGALSLMFLLDASLDTHGEAAAGNLLENLRAEIQGVVHERGFELRSRN